MKNSTVSQKSSSYRNLGGGYNYKYDYGGSSKSGSNMSYLNSS